VVVSVTNSDEGETLDTAGGDGDEDSTVYETGDPIARESGPRFVSVTSEVWSIEQELIRSGELPEDTNRAIPLRDHSEHGDDVTVEELEHRLTEEGNTEHPNKNRIAYLNKRLTTLRTPEENDP